MDRVRVGFVGAGWIASRHIGRGTDSLPSEVLRMDKVHELASA